MVVGYTPIKDKIWLNNRLMLRRMGKDNNKIDNSLGIKWSMPV